MFLTFLSKHTFSNFYSTRGLIETSPVKNKSISFQWIFINETISRGKKSDAIHLVEQLCQTNGTERKTSELTLDFVDKGDLHYQEK